MINKTEVSLAKETIDQIIDVEDKENEKEQKFVIDNDVKAEWAIRKILEERAETQRYIDVCDAMIAGYEEKKRRAIEKLENRTVYLKSLLNQYFQSVPRRKTKTREIYTLPSGNLVLKYPPVEFVRDDEKLISFLEANGYENFIEIKKIPKWGEFKKSLKILSGTVPTIVTEEGLIVEGVEAIRKSPEFDVMAENAK